MNKEVKNINICLLIFKIKTFVKCGEMCTDTEETIIAIEAVAIDAIALYHANVVSCVGNCKPRCLWSKPLIKYTQSV